MGLFVKICGLATADDVRAVGALLPDAVGFVFWPQSPRYVTADDVAVWTRELPPNILRVGVFVDTPPAEIGRIREQAGLDILQLHGQENTEEYLHLGCPIWRVLHLRENEEDPLEGNQIDAFLIDSYSSDSPGGTGMVCDWEHARVFVKDCASKVVLAGGLDATNVDRAIDLVDPWGVDVSSGVESEPGRKDIAKVRKFIEKCRKH